MEGSNKRNIEEFDEDDPKRVKIEDSLILSCAGKSQIPVMTKREIDKEIMKLKMIKTESALIAAEAKAVDIEMEVKVHSENVQQLSAYKPKPKALLKHQTEEDVGITQFIGEAKGIEGVIKHRFTDFIVHEISLEAEIVRLTDVTNVPVENAEIQVEKEYLINLLNADQQKHFEDLITLPEKESLKFNATKMGKEDRTKVHSCLKTHYPCVFSLTNVVGDERFIEIRQISKISKDKKRRANSWPKNRPEYTHFVLYKENRDTIDTVNMLASMLGVKSQGITYCGTKDKRAVTSQSVCTYHIEAERLLDLNKRLRNMRVGNVTYKKFPLKLGDHLGNRFHIVLRDITGSNSEVDILMKLLSEKGFINYYGLQRFGTTSVPTQSVGQAMLSNQYEKAIDLILRPRSGDDDSLAECRETWQLTKDPKKALEKLRYKGCTEGLLLKSMCKHNANDYVNALSGLPRNMRLLYLHAYQSLIWNKLTSRRISEMGLCPVEGDLWLPEEKLNDRSSRVFGSKETDKPKPSLVSKEDLENNRVSIYDVVIPLPGRDVIFPENEVFDWIKELLSVDEMDLDSFNSRIKSYSLSGLYRHILVKPDNVTWKVLQYADKDQDLNVTDKAILDGTDVISTDPQGALRALQMEMSLPTSCYATMAIRQITRKGTSGWAQTQ